MSRDLSPWATPAAVLVGALVLAAVVRSGFGELTHAIDQTRSDGAGRPGSLASPSQETTVTVRSATTPPATTVSAPDASELQGGEQDRQTKLRDDVNNAFAEQQLAYKAACAPPPGPPGPDYPPNVEADLTIDAGGLERGREFRSKQGPATKLMACLRALKASPLRVPAPGQERHVLVPLLLF